MRDTLELRLAALETAPHRLRDILLETAVAIANERARCGLPTAHLDRYATDLMLA